MFPRLLTTGVIAGFLAGLCAAGLQFVFVQPVLLTAELYESGAAIHGDPAAPTGLVGGVDLLRDGLSLVFSGLVYTGYGLVLVALMALAAERRPDRIDGRRGLVWGIAGFVTVQLAPALGLPPELPGMSAADLGARQTWWAATVVATGAGCALLGFGRSWSAWGAAVILVAAPHAIGAPQPSAFAGPTPPEIASLFAARALGVGFVAWTILGGLAGALWSRERVALGPVQA